MRRLLQFTMPFLIRLLLPLPAAVPMQKPLPASTRFSRAEPEGASPLSPPLAPRTGGGRLTTSVHAVAALAAIGIFAVMTLSCSGSDEPGSGPAAGSPPVQPSGLTPVVTAAKTGPAPVAAVATVAQPQPAPPGGGATLPSLGRAQSKDPDPARVLETVEFGLAPVDQVLLLMKEGQSRGDAESVASQMGGSLVGELEFLNLYQIETSGTTEADLKAALERARSLAGVEIAVQNAALFLKEIEGTRCNPLSDPYYQLGENGRAYQMIGLESAWTFIRACGLSLSEIHVGVMESSALYTGSQEVKGRTKFEGDATAEARIKDLKYGGLNHSTMVAHVLAADPDNGGAAGVAGVLGDKLRVTVSNMNSPGPELIPTQADPEDPAQVVNPEDGTAYLIKSLVLIKKQVESGAKVINCSFGADKPDASNQPISEIYRRFLQTMAKKHPDVLFVAAAGNENGALDGSNYSVGGHKLPNLITVGALDNNGARASFSNHATGNGEVTLAAPGVGIAMGPDFLGRSVNANGTSFASPMVAATAAILKSLNPKLTAEEIKKILVETGGADTAVGDRKVPVPANLGGKALRVDNAVLRVINDLRKEKGLPPFTREFLEKAGAIDASAESKGSKEYAIKAVVGAVGENGTEVRVEVQGEGMLSGGGTRRLDAAGELTWYLTLLDDQKPPTIKVTRLDNNACSTIILPRVEYAWKLVEVVDYENKEAWELASTDFWKIEHGYGQGSFNSRVWHKDDTNYVGYGARAEWSEPPKAMKAGEKVTLQVSLSETENTDKWNTSAAASWADFAPPERGLGARGDVPFAAADGATDVSINGASKASASGALTAVAPVGSEGRRIALRLTYYMGTTMATYYIYEWQPLQN